MVKERGTVVNFRHENNDYKIRLLGATKAHGDVPVRVFKNGSTHEEVYSSDLCLSRFQKEAQQWEETKYSVVKKAYRDDVKIRFQGHLVSAHNLTYYMWYLKDKGLSPEKMRKAKLC